MSGVSAGPSTAVVRVSQDRSRTIRPPMCDSGSGHSHRPGLITDVTASEFAWISRVRKADGLGHPGRAARVHDEAEPGAVHLFAVVDLRDHPPRFGQPPRRLAQVHRHHFDARLHARVQRDDEIERRRQRQRHAGAEMRTDDARSASSSYVSDPCGVSIAFTTAETSYGPPP